MGQTLQPVPRTPKEIEDDLNWARNKLETDPSYKTALMIQQTQREYKESIKFYRRLIKLVWSNPSLPNKNDKNIAKKVKVNGTS